MAARILDSGDELPCETLLRAHADSSLVLLSNLRAGGLVDRGERHQGTWAGAFDGDRLVGVAAHFLFGSVVLQAPSGTGDVARMAVERSGRALSGMLGPWAQVLAARDALGLADRPTRQASNKGLHALSLADLVVPTALAEGKVRCRRVVEADVDLLADWRAAYNIEENKLSDDEEMREQSWLEVETWRRERVSFVLTDGDVPVAYVVFHARLPDAVQLGGGWTPPERRGRGYARSLYAGALLEARAEGATRGVMFTNNPAARRACEPLGFRPVGEYGVVLFTTPVAR